MSLFNGFFVRKKMDNLSEEQSFLDKIEELNNKNLLRNKIFTGVNLNSNNLTFEAGFGSIFMAGSMGSGKSNAAVLIAAIALLSNSDQLKLHIVVPFGVASDYHSVQSYSQVNTITKPNSDFFEEIIVEIIERINRIKSMSCVDFKEMEQKYGLKLTRHLIIIEEAHMFLQQLMINDDWRLITRMAGHVGINFIYVSQRVSAEDLPSSFILAMFNRRMAFKMSIREEILHLIGYIPDINRFECHTESRQVLKFPYINRDNLKKLLDKNIKPLTTKSLIMKD